MKLNLKLIFGKKSASGNLILMVFTETKAAEAISKSNSMDHTVWFYK